MNTLLMAFQGTEELEQSGVLEASIEAVAEEAAKAEVQEATVEIQEVSAEVEKLAEKIEELEVAQEEIIEHVDGLESLLASGNYNAAAFAHIYRSAGRAAKKLGGSAHVAREGVESFPDASTAAINARAGIEGFSDTAKAWGKAAIEFIKSLFNRLISFVVGMVSKTAGLDKRIRFLETRVKDADIKADAKVKLGSWNTVLDIGSNKTPSKTLPSMESTGIFTSIFSSAFANKVESMVKAGDAGSILSDFKSAYTTLKGALKVGKEATGQESDSVGRVATVGAWRVVVSFFKDEVTKAEEMTAALRATKFSFTKDGEAAKKLVGDSVPALAKAELTATLGAAKATVTSVQNAKLEDQFSKSRRDKVVGLINVATKDAEDKKDAKTAVAFVKQYCATSGAFLTAVTKAKLKIAEAQVDCVAAHV